MMGRQLVWDAAFDRDPRKARGFWNHIRVKISSSGKRFLGGRD